jgi:hypothetical protein
VRTRMPRNLAGRLVRRYNVYVIFPKLLCNFGYSGLVGAVF